MMTTKIKTIVYKSGYDYRLARMMYFALSQEFQDPTQQMPETIDNTKIIIYLLMIYSMYKLSTI